MVDKNSNGFLSDMSGAVVGGRIYQKVPGAEHGIMSENNNQDMILVTRHKNSDVSDYRIIDHELVRRCAGVTDDFADQDTIEDLFFEKVSRSRFFRSFVFPFGRYTGENEKKEACSYTVAEIPSDFCDKYKPIDSVFRRGNFAFHSRILTVLNLAEAFFTLESYFDGFLVSLVPEAIYVNTDDGNVKIVIDRLLSRDVELIEENDECLRIVCDAENTIRRPDILRFVAYISYRLICIENPYDGKRALIDYPLMTNTAYKAINSGKYGFVFSTHKNEYSKYIAKEAFQRWSQLPGRIKNVFSAVLDNENITLDMAGWLKNMRLLRDCLVFVNGQFKLCDPEASNKVSFLASDDYYIPVWPRKALYWYHVGIPDEDVTSEVIAGINNDGYIENMTDEQWVVEYKSHQAYTAPGKSIKPEIGMDIEINNIHFQVVSGEKLVRTGVNLGGSPDYSGFSVEQGIDIIDLNDE